MHRALDGVPGAVVEDDEEHRQVVGAGDEVGGRGSAEDVGAVADAADQRLVRRGELGAEGGAQSPAEPARGRRREIGPRLSEASVGRVQVVLVDNDRLVVHYIAYAA